MLIWLLLVILSLAIGKYGDYEINKKFGEKTQCLTSYKLCFDFKTDSGFLNYLKGKEVKLED